jgi:hypothetical protein
MKAIIPYSEIKIIESPVDPQQKINSQLGLGWVLIGIEQERHWEGESDFKDVTKYILGKQVELNEY